MTGKIKIQVEVDWPKVEQLRHYLETHGWRSRPFPRPEQLVYEGPLSDQGDPLVLVFPSSEMLADYPLRIEELMRALSCVEDRPALDILRDMTAPASNGIVTPAPAPRRESLQAPSKKK